MKVLCKHKVNLSFDGSPVAMLWFPFPFLSLSPRRTFEEPKPLAMPPPSSRSHAGFTIVELLTVIAIMVLMIAAIRPVVNGLQGNRSLVGSAYGIAGALEQARTYAMANNTYTWVGFFQEDGSTDWKGTGTPVQGNGRIIVSVVASKDGTRYGAVPFGSVPLLQVSNLLKFNNVQTSALNSGATDRPTVNTGCEVGGPFTPGSLATGASFHYPLTGTARYTFSKIIEFNSQGEARKIGDSLPDDWMEIALQPTHGNSVDPQYQSKAAAAVLVGGLTGRIEVFKL